MQTTRIFAPWQNEASPGGCDYWHEIARPQVHGHDINCVTIIYGKGNHRFVSGANEKVARVFEAPLSFLKTLNHAISQKSSFPEDLQADVQILGANMSALGLSQKPIYVHCESLSLSLSLSHTHTHIYTFVHDTKMPHCSLDLSYSVMYPRVMNSIYFLLLGACKLDIACTSYFSWFL